MAALDRRLLRRAREARVALAVDALLGLIAALLVLAQAVLLARVAARSFDGASLTDVAVPLALLAAVVLARASTAWGFNVVGRRAAGRVLSRLRLELVRARLTGNPPSTVRRAPRSRRSPSRESTRSRRRSPATCPRSCWRRSFRSRC
jgi:hypothetical protein